MSKKVITCADSTCDLSPELKEKYQISTYPLHVLLEEKSYSDGVDLTPDEIYATYRERKVLPKTAAVNAAEYEEFCKPWLDDGCEIVYISLGSGLSTSHNNCRLAAEELEGLYVVDSKNLSTGSGLLVLAAAERAQAGMSAAQIAEELRALVPTVESSFVIDNLEFLHKGGRCSTLAMMGANVLQLKPCIEVRVAENGSMGVGKKYRGSLDKCLQQYVKDRLEGRTDIDTHRIFITHSGISDERVELVRNEVQKYAQFDEILVTRAGCTISAHCGPNTLGILFMTK